MRFSKSLLAIVALVLLLGSCAVSGYNGLVSVDESVDAAWGELRNQYKRRFDLVPQLVETVKGAAEFERGTLNDVVEARASVAKVELPDGGDAAESVMNRYLEAQGELGRSLGRLLVTVERYPDLKTSQSFLSLQDQLEGTENRIAVARRDYIDEVKRLNTKVRRFPSSLLAGMFGFETRPQLDYDEPVEERPVVDFGSGDGS